MQIDNEHIQPKLEKYINLEEELESKQDEKRELEDKREKIKKAMEYLEIAYYKMKQEITPKFTDKLSKTISKISDKKYQNVRINTKGEIIEYLASKNKKVFLDLKFHDIPNTTAMASLFAAKQNIFMFNVHTSGGKIISETSREDMLFLIDPDTLLRIYSFDIMNSTIGGLSHIDYNLLKINFFALVFFTSFIFS